MIKKLTKSELTNTRFLVSVWHPTGTPIDIHNLETLQGTVWEADPRVPGRIAAPESFVGLSALPNLLGGFLSTYKNATATDSGGEKQ